MKKSEERLWEYERIVKNFFEETDLGDIDETTIDFDDLVMFRYGLEGETVEEIDRKYLPQIYEAITSRYPELKDYVLRSLKSAGVNLSILQKIPV